MKDSGINYIGDIPKEYNVIRTRFLCEISTGNKDTINRTDDGEFPFFVRSQNIERIDTFSYDGEAVLTAGDGDVGKIFHYIDGKFDFHQRVYKFSDFNYVDGKYFYYYIVSNFGYELGKYSAKTTVESLRLPWIKDFPIIVPPHEIQQKIASYLDKKVALIDNIIEKTKQSIEEYKKYKQSLINDVITKGLHYNVPMIESGVDWIGEVPEHWQVMKLKYLFEIVKRISGELGYNVLSVTQGGLKVKDLSSNEGQLSADYSKYQFVFQQDYVMNHMDLLTGWVDLSSFDGVTSPDYRVFRMKEGLIHSKEYFLYIFQACYLNRVFYGLGQGVSNLGRWRLQTDKFINFQMPVPPIEEQIEITDFLKSKLTEIEKFVRIKEEYIQELEAYKKSLIYEVVTGKKEIS